MFIWVYVCVLGHGGLFSCVCVCVCVSLCVLADTVESGPSCAALRCVVFLPGGLRAMCAEPGRRGGRGGKQRWCHCTKDRPLITTPAFPFFSHSHSESVR